MREKMEACPFEAQTRASKCEGCCANSGGLTPCVAAWLAAKAGYVDLVGTTRAMGVLELTSELRRAA